jgi:hypothetical protein
MRTPACKWLLALMAVVLFNAGCDSQNVLYNKDRKTVSNVWEGDFAQGKGFIPCNKSVEVYYHGDFYGIYFKTNSVSPRDFYFTMAKHYGYDKLPLKIIEARGLVQLVDERKVVFDVEYKDNDGKWTKLPFNGTQKVNQVWPDDIPKNPKISL